jgi:hypothetical protein
VLLGRAWVLEHPAGWADDERDRALALARERCGAEVDAKPEDSLAGRAAHSQRGALVDMSVAGLLANERSIEGELLAEFNRAADGEHIMSKAVIQWIGGPVLKARVSDPFHIHEALAVGKQRLLGEVIQLSGDTITAQVYEDTTGLKPGDPVEGTGLPLSVALGPGILGRIFDGLLRPLGDVTEHWFKPGLAAKRTGSSRSRPAVEKGDDAGAAARSSARSPGTGPGRACLVPPNVAGRVVSIEAAGAYPKTPRCWCWKMEGPASTRAVHAA